MWIKNSPRIGYYNFIARAFDQIGRARVFLALVFFGIVGIAFFAGVLVQSTVRDFLVDYGISDGSNVARNGKLFVRQLRSKMPLYFANTKVPELYIDIKFKNLSKIYRKREEALERGFLSLNEDDYVPALISSQGQKTKVKMRLKGDWLDHITSEKKWSFRIATKGKGQILGMRRFSIQHPKVRGYINEALFMENLKSYGVLSPRYFFARVIVNGDDIGLMAVEEHFSKELIEFNKRRESVMLKFDESLMWDQVEFTGWHGVFLSYKNALIDSFQSNKVQRNENLRRDLETAVGLMRGFVERKLRPSQVFDPISMGRFLAIADLWGVEHGVYFQNMRFYFNPIIGKVEPIGYDNNVPLIPSIERPSFKNRFTADILKDPEIFSVYKQTLEKLYQDIVNGNLLDRLEILQKRHLSLLLKEYYFLLSYDLPQLKRRVKQLSGHASMTEKEGKPLVATLAHANLIQIDEGKVLELSNTIPEEVEVVAIEWHGKSLGNDDPAIIPFEFKGQEMLPIKLPPTFMYTNRTIIRIPYSAKPHILDGQLIISARSSTSNQLYRIKAKNYSPVLSYPPVPRATVGDVLRAHSYISFDAEQSRFTVKPGQWDLKSTIIIPKGMSLLVPANVTLRFAPDAALISRGPIMVSGNKGGPVVFEGMSGQEGAPGGWLGIAVLRADERSHWSWATVRNTTGVQLSNWRLTGGVNFYESNASFMNVTSHGNKAEDAINFVRSEVLIENLLVTETRSDGVDFDFSTVKFIGGVFQDIGVGSGGDGLDFSGSKAVVRDTRFERIGDKAVSVGEGSVVTADNLVINSASVGVASKDRSELTIKNSKITEASIAGIMVYIKKPEYGPAKVLASNIEFVNSDAKILVQTGSDLVIDGARVETQDIDISQLYQ